jgi:hypothetical protein
MLGAAVGCAEDDGEDCDPQTEIEVFYGSDVTDEPSVTACEEAPATCDDAPDCECLRGQVIARNNLQLDFCLDEGSCEVNDDGVVAIVCPGG